MVGSSRTLRWIFGATDNSILSGSSIPTPIYSLHVLKKHSNEYFILQRHGVIEKCRALHLT
jgi:hypothetical protein